MTAAGRLIADRYALTTMLGRGGMGQVWKAHDKGLERDVAVKLMRTELLSDAWDENSRTRLLRRFARESRTTARLDHPGLVTVYDAGSDNNELYLVMQYIDGMSLADLIAEHENMPWQWAVAVAAQTASALAVVHAAGIVHRDLKPGNVMVRADGRTTVLDLGIAAVREAQETQLTNTGEAPGTPAYIPPEQSLYSVVLPAGDLYALGVLIHEMLTGEPTFTGPTPAAVTYRHVADPPAPLRTLRADVPEALEALVLDLLAKKPEDRPPHAQAVFARLAPLLPAQQHDARPGVPFDPTRPFRQPMAPLPLPGGHQPAPERKPDPVEDIAAAVEQASGMLDSGDFTQAVGVLRGALPQAVRSLGESDPRVLMLRRQYAQTLLMDGKFVEALPELRRLYEQSAAAYGPSSPQAREYQARIDQCLNHMNRSPYRS